MAEYADDNQLLDAARKVKDSGYTRIDAFTPFAVHGIDEAIGIKPTALPWFTLCAGFAGLTVALTMEYWMNAVDYPYIISGKPYASWPAFIPVAFELTVLFSAFTTVFAMLGLNGLPRFSSPFFSNPKFDRTTDDRFFLWIGSSDKYFNSEKVQSLLTSTGALSVEEVREDDSPSDIPKPIIFAIIAGILVTLIPGAIVLNMRNAKSGESRLHVFFDMDFQPSRHTQTSTAMFADGRVQRPPVPGTVARGELGATDPYTLGYDPSQTVSTDSATAAAKLVSFQQDGEVAGDESKGAEASETPAVEPSETEPTDAEGVAAEEVTADPGAQPAADEAAPAAAAGVPNYAWLTELPVEANGELFELGRHKFEQHCALCHGYGGYGNGLVAQRAAELAQGYWLQPANLHDQAIEEQPVGRIYYTITHGKGKMGSYAASLTPEERWAVVAYVKALQRSQNAQPSDIPTRGDIAQ
ncbi:MAG: DUF3341 domain-containing protein [Pirellulaceae bacterium]|nr:DUF3341 domain-containing protein [Pirellulaceae bacterium]